MIQSHDFASTYVGTPFYMSPEICAAERYTLKSDIWSLGCIIYELCAREPPFNAKSHYQLVQKIKDGKIAPLPRVYSAELFSVIKDCLRVNPDVRPDTATLLNLPVVRLMRKEKEAVEMGNMLNRRSMELKNKIAEVEKGWAAKEQAIRESVDMVLRREWELKARLEIDRLVKGEIEQLRRRFDAEVHARVQEELQKKAEAQEFVNSLPDAGFPHSSIGASTDCDFPSTTDITEFESPEPMVLKKSTRTPFGRAQTMFERVAGTPMDIEMASPSPIAIASLSLSPRRNNATKPPPLHQPNLFDGQGRSNSFEPDLHNYRDCSNMFDSDDEHSYLIDSPTRPPKQQPPVKSTKNPFGPSRPVLNATKTAPTTNRLRNQTSSSTSPINNKPVPDLQARPQPSNGALRERYNSPNRRLSKIPSVTNLGSNGNNHSSGSSGENGGSGVSNGQRKTSGSSSSSASKKDGTTPGESQQHTKAATTKNNVKGRTLIELQQARAGGRPVDSTGSNVSPKRGTSTGTTFKERVAAATAVTAAAAPPSAASSVTDRSSFMEPVAVWDPEKDEMPSPFLVRRKMARV